LKFNSTRADNSGIHLKTFGSSSFSLSDAIQMGLAYDGGLFVPKSVPKIDLQKIDFSELSKAAPKVLEAFFENDDLADKLDLICKNAFDFPIPLKKLNDSTCLLELFHGPTCAFKDFAARFLAQCFSFISPGDGRTIIVATSGDTGGAVAAAFCADPSTEVGILFPKGLVSELQQRQLTCWGGNIHAFSVRGTFDDCQKIAKSCFQDDEWPHRDGLTSANSINIGRLLPQIAYFAFISAKYSAANAGVKANFVIPSGNMGNAAGCFYAREMGFPIGHIAIATNANRTLSEYFQSHSFIPRPSVPTLANAMDIGNPSNMERLFHLFPDQNELFKNASAISVSNDDITATILEVFKKYNEIICPHTACGFYARQKMQEGHWIIVATAHPAKFESIVEPIIGQKIPVPEALKNLLNQQETFFEIDANLESFRSAWNNRHTKPF
jgi:threonine synthase